MYQNFVAPIVCIDCGVTTSDSSSEMQMGILTRGIEPPPLYLYVGDVFSMIDNGPLGAGFHEVRKPQHCQQINLLQLWECPSCGRVNQWAEIVLVPLDSKDNENKDDNKVRVESIHSTLLQLDVLDRVHFITDQLTWAFKDITGVALELDDTIRPDFMDLLRQQLEK